jgi:hypothetical protein
MGRTDEEGDGAAFSELAALLQRNEDEERRAADVETDMQRLLLLTRDAALREQLVQAQGVRRVTLLAKAASTAAIQRFCAGYERCCEFIDGRLCMLLTQQCSGRVLGCLAHSERGRLSASSCNKCVLEISSLRLEDAS